MDATEIFLINSMLYNILNSTCLSGSLVTNRDSSDVFETLVVAAAMDWARCSQVVVFLLLFPLRLGRDLPPISEHTFRNEDVERGAWEHGVLTISYCHSKTNIATCEMFINNFYLYQITFIIFIFRWYPHSPDSGEVGFRHSVSNKHHF